MRFYNFVVAIVIAVSPFPTLAADKSQLATQLFDAIIVPQAEPLVDRMLLAMARENNPPAEVLKIYKETLLEVFRHPEYREAYISAYMRLFSEQELTQIIELSKSPAFLAFARESSNVTQLTYPTFAKINAQMKKKLETRLTEKGLSKWK